jgi:hypothetical protein
MTVDVGDIAPEIDLPDDTGGRWRLSDQRETGRWGRPVLVVFHRHLA